MPAMDETHYNHLVAAAFQRLMGALDQTDPDLLDADSTGDMVTITAASDAVEAVTGVRLAL